jgi:cardiolipin synthase (CMP-forming)
VKWLPNLLTGLRIALVPVLIHLMSRVTAADRAVLALSSERAWAIGVLLAISLSDFADGWAARRYQAMSRLGSLLDVLADRLALLAPLLYLALIADPGFPRVPLWFPLWLAGLDVLAGTSWAVARARRGAPVPLEHSPAGRMATALLFVLMGWIMLGLPDAGVLVIGLPALGTATVSAVRYAHGWSRGPDLDGMSVRR